MAGVTYNSGTIATNISTRCDNILDLGTISDDLTKNYSRTYAAGTGANQVQIQWHDQRTLLTTTDETLDLENLTNAFGTATFDLVKELVIMVTTTTAGYRLLIGAAAANQFSGFVADPSDIVYVGAGGLLRLSNPVDGYLVDATHSDLKIENPSGGSVVYDIIIIGTGTVA